MSWGNAIFCYDANGNMTQKIEGSTTNYTYDAENRVEPAGSWTALLSGTARTQTEFIGAEGLSYRFRVRAVDNVGNVSAWVEGDPSTVQTTVTKYYYLAGQRVAMCQGSAVSYLYGDHLGSTSLVTDASGATLAETRYQPYGQPYWQWGATRTDFGFTGQRLDGFGLMDYNARYYSSTLGRFISPDTIVPSVGEGNNPNAIGYLANTTYSALTVDYHENQFLEQLNQENKYRLDNPNEKLPGVPFNPQAFDRYAYSLNNPVRYHDPTGHLAIVAALALISPAGWVAIGALALIGIVYYVSGGPEAFGEGAASAIQTFSNQVITGVNLLLAEASKKLNDEQQAVDEWASEAADRPRRGKPPLTADEADALSELANEAGLSVDNGKSHIDGGHWDPFNSGQPIPHIHINGRHIPVPKGYVPK